MSGLEITTTPVRLSGKGKVLHKPGAVLLDAYPLLVFAPAQYGKGIRTEDRGIHVADIVNAFAQTPDYDAVADRLHTTAEHVRQAVAYALATGYATQ